MNTEKTSVKTALISVSNKENIIELGKGLDGLGIEIISTGGTAKALRDVGITVTNVSDYTGFPEIMEGRVKTINPLVEGGILGLRDKHAEDAEAHNIKWIDLVVCNLYPFAETIQKPDVTLDMALEKIDIGGPTMIRSAAKNVGWVGVVVDPADYDSVLNELQEHGGLTFDNRKRLSAKAFGHTTKYDTLIHNYLKSEPLSDDFSLTFEKYYDLRYGENPHQQAAAYKAPIATGSNILNAVIHQGKKLSYNNIMDADGALDCVKEFDEPAVWWSSMLIHAVSPQEKISQTASIVLSTPIHFPLSAELSLLIEHARLILPKLSGRSLSRLCWRQILKPEHWNCSLRRKTSGY